MTFTGGEEEVEPVKKIGKGGPEVPAQKELKVSDLQRREGQLVRCWRD